MDRNRLGLHLEDHQDHQGGVTVGSVAHHFIEGLRIFIKATLVHIVHDCSWSPSARSVFSTSLRALPNFVQQICGIEDEGKILLTGMPSSTCGAPSSKLFS